MRARPSIWLPLLLVWVGLTLAGATAAEPPEYTRTEDVVYGRKFGMALTLDVFRPAHPNGHGVLFIVSGGFFSAHDGINPGFYRPLLDRGYTVFAVVHGSQPRFIIPEIELDIHRAVRFVRHHAAEYGVDPAHLGISGASAGGHLSLMVGTRGRGGDPAAADSVDRESSAVQAVACFFPPTDFLNWSREAEDGVGYGPTEAFNPAFGPRARTAGGRHELGAEISPINYVGLRAAPTLILHGDADRVVPIYQSRRFAQRCQEAGAVCVVEERPGKGHGWSTMAEELPHFADWFDHYLRGLPVKNTASPKAK